MTSRSFVVGVGMTPFQRPGTRGGDYPAMAGEAARGALSDAGIELHDVEHAAVGYVHAESTAGQRCIYGLGMTSIPIQNLTNNCASGSSALFYARQLVTGGLHDCVLALGFEVMQPGSLGARTYPATADPLEHFYDASWAVREPTGAPVVLDLFRNATLEHMERYGTTREQLAAVAAKNHRHSANNPYAQFRDVYSVEDVLASPTAVDPLTRLQCSPTSDGAAAAVVCSEAFVDRHGLWDRAVEILAQSMTTDGPETFEGGSAIDVVGRQVSARGALQVYEESGLGPDDLDVIELHDCFSVNELITTEALGLCPEGAGGGLVEDGQTTYGGRWVVNPSGGLISKGHPLGATGLAQCAELTWQLRGAAGARQVDGARVALAHNVGLGSAGVVTMYGQVA